jgi:hypothetical protein
MSFFDGGAIFFEPSLRGPINLVPCAALVATQFCETAYERATVKSRQYLSGSRHRHADAAKSISKIPNRPGRSAAIVFGCRGHVPHGPGMPERRFALVDWQDGPSSSPRGGPQAQIVRLSPHSDR